MSLICGAVVRSIFSASQSGRSSDSISDDIGESTADWSGMSLLFRESTTDWSGMSLLFRESTTDWSGMSWLFRESMADW